MAPPPPDASVAPLPPVADSPRPLPTPFLSKTYQIVDDPAVDDVISWSADGSAFVVWRPAEFARDLLPQYFKHNNFSSFVRQLNTYGFRKVVPDRWEFANDCFRRGERRLLSDIHRRKIPAAPPPEEPPVPTSPEEERPAAAQPDLARENERLRRENGRLRREISRMTALLDGVALLLAGARGAPPPLELMPMRSDEDAEDLPDSEGSAGAASVGGAAMLFGVQIGAKRIRVEGGGALDPDVKCEPLDHRIGDCRGEAWGPSDLAQ